MFIQTIKSNEKGEKIYFDNSVLIVDIFIFATHNNYVFLSVSNRVNRKIVISKEKIRWRRKHIQFLYSNKKNCMLSKVSDKFAAIIISCFEKMRSPLAWQPCRVRRTPILRHITHRNQSKNVCVVNERHIMYMGKWSYACLNIF